MSDKDLLPPLHPVLPKHNILNPLPGVGQGPGGVEEELHGGLRRQQGRQDRNQRGKYVSHHPTLFYYFLAQFR